ncbi:RNA-directed DNA polymerase, eukaryota, reverse transcriptase zinc-binding domain protein [Tanacetum coccineum]|uniref:RNA-directed DNA polymerase, eukaryota, reverse transcriptase zinc-binding domain protein n=1 Tax=Tanacetum coccineum TaxID=301880 RepID=A0ABQ5GXC9_9ASTR
MVLAFQIRSHRPLVEFIKAIYCNEGLLMPLQFRLIKDARFWCFNLELQKDISVALKLQSNDFALSLRRQPRSGGHDDFSVKSAREVIDKHVLITSSTPTRWYKVLPIKLNIFMWRMLLDKLPTRSNLAIRGLDVPCSLCRRWNIQVPILLDPSTWESWLNSLRLNTLQKLVLKASFSSLWWHIWVFKNATLFSSKKPLKGIIFNNFVSQTFTWVLNRCRKFNCNWVDWLRDP